MRAKTSASTRLRIAIERRNLGLVRLAAAEVNEVDLEDALAILLLIAEQQPDLFERAGVRWAGRVLADAPELGFARAAELLAALPELVGANPELARSRIALLLRAVGLIRLAVVLESSA